MTPARKTPRAAFVMLMVVGACARTPTSPSGISVNTMSPTSGPVGVEITLTGTGFAATGNVVKFGPGYIGPLNSPDGTTLRFTVPSHHDVCPPEGSGITAPCADMHPAVQPTEYPVSVFVRSQASREMTFKVEPR